MTERTVATPINKTLTFLKEGDVRAFAVVIVTPAGVSTAWAGVEDGYYHQLNSGIADLRRRFDKEASE